MKVEFLKSIYHIDEYKGYGLPEVAFVGRSNVGKSSLINTLFQCKIAFTSKKPGKTRCINLFKVETGFVVADLPGYGYARVSKKMQEEWKELIESYVAKSKFLKAMVILSDVKRGLEEEELQLIDWLKFLKKPYLLVFTKTDKLSRNELANLKKEQKDLKAIYFSSVTGEGRKELFGEIKGLVKVLKEGQHL